MLRSVERHLPGARVIIVDCGSTDQTVARGRASACAAVHALGENIGFGRASNRGLAVCNRPVTALVNPDVELVDDSLLLLAAEALRRDRPERLLAPLVLNLDGSRQDSVHPAPGSAADLVRSVIPPALVPGRAGDALAPWRAHRPRRVGWAVGCALVARLATWTGLGPFDEEMFLFGEDLELGLRARAAGVETWFWPNARVVHEGAHSTRAAFGGEPLERLASARRDAIRRTLGPRQVALDDAVQSVTFASRLALKRALGRAATRECRQLQALARARRAVAGAR
jgi:GT2 family glycosyltransferase